MKIEGDREKKREKEILHSKDIINGGCVNPSSLEVLYFKSGEREHMNKYGN